MIIKENIQLLREEIEDLKKLYCKSTNEFKDEQLIKVLKIIADMLDKIRINVYR